MNGTMQTKLNKVGDHVRISKYKFICANVYTPNSSEEVSMIKKVAILFRVHTLLVNGEKIIETISEKELQKTNQTEFRVEKAMKKGNKLNVK